MVDCGAVEVDARVDDWSGAFWDMRKRAFGVRGSKGVVGIVEGH